MTLPSAICTARAPSGRPGNLFFVSVTWLMQSSSVSARMQRTPCSGSSARQAGSAPGGWSQVAGKLVGAKGRVLATDILAMDGLSNVDFIQGDFTEDAIVQQIHDWLGGWPYESISPAQTERFMTRLGFERVRAFARAGVELGVFGSGCDEYVYARK